MHRSLLLALFALFDLSTALAQQTPPEPTAPPVQLDTIAVTGTQPGPGLWRVSKDDHVLWILGTVSPLPRDVQWRSNDLDARIADAQEVLTAPEVEITANTGVFGTLALLPSLIGLRNNPDGQHLRDVVPGELYARWAPLKQRYIGRSDRVEKWRPIFAALELYDAAMEKNRLTGAAYVRKRVLASAKHAHVPITTPRFKVEIEQPREALREFKTGPLDDTQCFHKTLDRIDADLVAMTVRANAWATGDVAALRKLPQSDQAAACLAAVSESNLARSRGMTDLDTHLDQAWLDAARAALERNRTTVALLPMSRLLADDGYLARLGALGYAIEAPDADAVSADSGAAAP